MEDEIMKRLKLKVAISEIKRENEIIMRKRKSFINKKIAMVACFCLLLTTGVIFSKDIEAYFKSLFLNSNKAIEEAVENGYVQKENMGYVYDKDIGIKVDSLVLDDLNLNISFAFEVQDENIRSIRFDDFIITTDKGKLVYESEIKYAETIEELRLADYVNWINESQKMTNTTFIDSILFGLRQTDDEINELNFEVNRLNIVHQDDMVEKLEGNWNFNVVINDEMRKSSNINYILKESNKYVESCKGTLSPTGMIVELNLYDSFNAAEYILAHLEELNDTGLFYLKSTTETLLPSYFTGTKEITLHYDNIGTFYDNINILELYMKPFESTIILVKAEN